MVREVLKYNKNHITGDLKEVKCFKPHNGVKGNAKIELFNNDGRLINETYTENIIPSKHILDCELYRVLVRSILDGQSNYMFGGESQSKSFNNLILSTSEREENEEVLCSDGDVIGWCPKTDTNAGSDVTRGVYNPTESYTKYENGYYHSHLVYDFGTSQANGTFNSIWWSKNVQSNDKFPSLLFSNVECVGGIDRTSNIYTGAFGNYFYHDKNKTIDKDTAYYYRVKNPEAYINGINTLEVDKNVKFDSLDYLPLTICELNSEKGIRLDNNITGSGIASSDIVIFDNNFKDIERININYYTLENIEPALKRDTYTRMRAEKIFDVSDNGDVTIVFYAWSTTNSYSYAFLPYYNSKEDTLENPNSQTKGYILGVYNIFSKSWVLEPSTKDINCFRINSCTDIIKILGYIYIDNKKYFYRTGTSNFLGTCSVNSDRSYHWNISYLSRTNFSLGYYGSYSNHFVCAHIHGTNVLFNPCESPGSSSSYVGGAYLRPVNAYSAHTKLPAPVTKTSADTMKVTYDYYVQIPKMAATDGDFLTLPEAEL